MNSLVTGHLLKSVQYYATKITVCLCILVLSNCSQHLPGKNIQLTIISSSNLYGIEQSLQEYKTYLTKHYTNIDVHFLQAGGALNEKNEFSELKGTEILKNTDILLLFARRSTISGEALNDIKNYLSAGKPIVALGPSSHAFQNWPEFDKEILGCTYNGHYTGEPGSPVKDSVTKGQQVTLPDTLKKHSILNGIDDFSSGYTLYHLTAIAKDATLLLNGSNNKGRQPIAFARTFNNTNIVYIALGDKNDWLNPVFPKLVTNALSWAGDFTPIESNDKTLQ